MTIAASSRSLLRDCEIFANLRLKLNWIFHFVFWFKSHKTIPSLVSPSHLERNIVFKIFMMRMILKLSKHSTQQNIIFHKCVPSMGIFQSNCHIFTNVKRKWKSWQKEGHDHLTKNKTFQSNSFVVFWQKWYYIYWTMIEKWGRARLSRVWNVESSAQHHQSVIYQSAVGADEGNNRIMQWWLHLQTKVPKDYAKISQSRRKPQLGSWLHLLALSHVRHCEDTMLKLHVIFCKARLKL